MPHTPVRSVLMLLAAGHALAFLSLGIRHGFGLFLPHMTEAYGWGREVFGFAMAVQILLWGLIQPLSGALADRYGSGRVIALGGLLYSAGLFGMARADTPLLLMLSMGVVMALGMAFAGFSIALGVVGRVASDDKRSLYLGIVMAGTSLGMLIMAPLEQYLIESMGWQKALDAMALMALSIVVLAAFLTGKPAHEPDDQRKDAVNHPLQALRQATAQPRFWLLFWGFFVCGFHVSFVGTHLPAYIKDTVGSTTLGTLALSMIGLFNFFGVLFAGYIGGKVSKRISLSVIYLARAAVFTVFIALPVTPWTVIGFSAALGLLWLSTVPLTSGLVGQMFGVRYMATLFGLVFLGHQIGGFLGVWAGGWVYDVTGSYQSVWYAAIALALFAALIHWPIDERDQETLGLAPGRPATEV